MKNLLREDGGDSARYMPWPTAGAVSGHSEEGTPPRVAVPQTLRCSEEEPWVPGRSRTPRVGFGQTTSPNPQAAGVQTSWGSRKKSERGPV